MEILSSQICIDLCQADENRPADSLCLSHVTFPQCHTLNLPLQHLCPGTGDFCFGGGEYLECQSLKAEGCKCWQLTCFIKAPVRRNAVAGPGTWEKDNGPG